MPYRVQFDSGHTVDFDNQPSPEDIAHVAQQFGQQAQQTQGHDLEDSARTIIGGGLAKGAGSLAQGGLIGLGGIAGAMGMDKARDTAFGLHDEVEQGIQHRLEQTNSTPQTATERMGQAAVGMAPMVAAGALNPALGMGVLGASSLGSGAEEARNLTEQGVDSGTANTVGVGSAIMQTAMAPLGGNFGGISGAAATNVAQGMITRGVTNSYLDSQGYKDVTKMRPGMFDPESMITDAVTGGIVGGVMKFHKGETPEETPKPGKIPPKGLDMDALFAEGASKPIAAQEETPGRAPRTPSEDTTPWDVNDQRQALPRPEDVAIEQAGGNQYNPEGRAPRTPSEEPEQIPDEKQGLLSLEPKDARDNLRQALGNASDDGVNFALRQEVLDHPDVRQAVDDYRELANQMEVNGDTKGRQELAEGFAQEMAQYGVYQPSDAYGRGLYEAKSREQLVAEANIRLVRDDPSPENVKAAEMSLVARDAADGTTNPATKASNWWTNMGDRIGGLARDSVSTPRDLHHLADGNGKIDPVKALDWISKNSNNPALRRAANFIKLFPKTVRNMTITSLPKEVFDGGANDHDAVGMYSSKAHEITLGHEGTNDRILIHEMIHGITDRGIRYGKGAEFDKLRGTLNNILNNVRGAGREQSYLSLERIPVKVPDATASSAQSGRLSRIADHVLRSDRDIVRNRTYDFQGQGGSPTARAKIYGLTNVHELLAESIANSNFQSLLTNLKVGKQSALGRIFDAIRGVTKVPTNTLHDLFDSTMAMAQLVERDNKLNGTERMSQFKDATSINDHLSMMAGRVQDKIGEDPRVEHIADIPGLESIAKKNIPAAPDPKMVKQLALGEKDIDGTFFSKLGRDFTVSAEQIANIARSKAMYAASRIFDRAQKLSHSYDEHVVTPLREQIKSLIPDSQWQQLKTIKDVMIQESLRRKNLSDDQLRGAGFTDKMLQAHHLLRDEFAKQLDIINEKRLEQGLDPVTAHEAYSAASWGGAWKAEVHVKVRDEQGNVKVDGAGNEQTKLAWYLAGHSKNEVRTAQDWINKNHPNPGDVVHQPIEYRKSLTADGKDHIGALMDLQRMLGKDDPTVQGIRKIIEAKAQMEGVNFQGTKVHFENKSGIRGFQGDRPWMNPRDDTRAWWGSQFDYLSNGVKWAHYQDAVGNMKQITADPDLIKQRPNLVSFLKEYSRQQLGFGKDKNMQGLENKASKFVGEFLDTVPGLKNIPSDLRSQVNGLRNAKQWFYLSNLGFGKLQHLIVNGVFQPMFSIPRHMKLSAEGYDHNPLTTLVKGMEDSQHILLDHYTGGRAGELKGFTKEMADYLRENQIATNNPFSDVGELGETPYNQAMRKVQAIGGWTMQEGERVGRVNAFVSYAHHLQQSGKFTDNLELFREAERHTTETMGSFRHSDRPGFFTKLGVTGTALVTLRQFEINQYNQLYDYAKLARQKGNYAPLLAFMGLQFAFAGAAGFFGMETLDSMYRYIRDLIPTKFVSREFATWSPKSFIMKTLPVLGERGPVSALTGVNLASSLESGTIVDPSLAGLFPFISDIYNKTAAVGKFLNNPNSDTMHTAIWNMAPTSMKGAIEAQTNWFKGPNGVSASPNNPGTGIYKRSPEEDVLRTAGFMPTNEADTKERLFMAKDQERVLKERQQSALEGLDSAVRNGDQDSIQGHILDYVRMSGDPRTALSNQRFHDLIIKWNTVEQQRMAMGRMDLSEAQKYQRLMQMLRQ